MKNSIRPVLLSLGGFLFILDRLFKYLSTHDWSGSRLLNSFFGWLPSLNHGIAFGLPVPGAFIILLSLFFIALLIWFYIRHADVFVRAGIILILLGAFSNLFDRIFFGHTLDYFLVLTSIFNLADVLVVAGAGLCLLMMRKNSPC